MRYRTDVSPEGPQSAAKAFNGDARLVDDASKALIRDLLDNLVRRTRQMRK